MKINLILPGHRTPRHLNDRKHWREIVKEKHQAQAALLSALHSAASGYSTSMPSMPQSKICSTAYDSLALYVATKRVKSISKSTSKGSARTTKNKPKSK